MTDPDVLTEARTLREEWLSSAVTDEVYGRTRPLIDCMAKLAAEVERLRIRDRVGDEVIAAQVDLLKERDAAIERVRDRIVFDVEVAGLPAGTIIRTSSGDVYRRGPKSEYPWDRLGDDSPYRSAEVADAIPEPAQILWHPDEDGAR